MSGRKRVKKEQVFDYGVFAAEINKNQPSYIKMLAETVAIKSISADINRQDDCGVMGKWLHDYLKKLGAKVDLVDIGSRELEGQTVKIPPLVVGSLGNDPKLKTLCVYGHYDVQPAELSDGWDTDPFVLKEANGKLYGRGSTDDKAPVLGWLCAVEAFQNLGVPVGVNMKFIFEGTEESGSAGLAEYIEKEKNGFFKDVDYICISDNYWLGKDTPCLTYGLRGVSYYSIEVSGPGADLHSGVFGGAVHEPMTDLVAVMSKLVDSQGKILVPGVMDDVPPVTEAEKKLYDNIDFNHKDFHDSIGSQTTIHEKTQDTLMHRWRFPTLSLHGIEGAFYGIGAKTVIPSKVIGKFSIRTVPNQKPEKLKELVFDYIEKEFAKLPTKNKLKVDMIHSGPYWSSDPNNKNFEAAKKAMKQVFNKDPDFTREGGSIPVTVSFQDILQREVILLPMGACDDGAHSINEKINISNYIEGIKVLGTYIQELAKY